MNYQKLFSRFYNPGEPQNSDLPKCEGFGGVPSEEPKLQNVPDDSAVEFDYGQREDDDTIMCEIDNANISWDTSIPELPTVIEPISSEHVSIAQ